MRAVLGGPFRSDVCVGVRWADELLGARAVRRVDGGMPVLRPLDGLGLLCRRGDARLLVGRRLWGCAGAESLCEWVMHLRVRVCESRVLCVL